jgi:tetratricopeptide (TPR) repeat protein
MGHAAAPAEKNRRVSSLVPPPFIRDGDGGAPAGMAILGEVEGVVGACLWIAIRRLHRWILDGPIPSSGSGCRELLDGPGSEFGSIFHSVRTLFGLEPTPLDASGLAVACDAVRRWSMEAERYQTAAFFAEAAAYLLTDDPAAANAAARSCRSAVLYDRAAHWYQRARSLAVRSGSRGEAVQALLGTGSLMYHLGYHKTAKTFLGQAKRRAVHSGRRLQAARAEHDLLLIAAEERQLHAGIHHTAEALRLYPLSNARVPYLAHDFAHFLTRLRIFAPALPILRAVSNLLPRASDQVLVASTIARAAAGAGERQLYDHASERVLEFIQGANQYAAPAYKNLAMGAWQLGEWDRAAGYASLAIEVAAPRHEREPLQAALRLRTKLADRELPPPPMDPPAGTPIEALQRRCFMGLKAYQRRAARGPAPPSGF